MAKVGEHVRKVHKVGSSTATINEFIQKKVRST